MDILAILKPVLLQYQPLINKLQIIHNFEQPDDYETTDTKTPVRLVDYSAELIK